MKSGYNFANTLIIILIFFVKGSIAFANQEEQLIEQKFLGGAVSARLTRPLKNDSTILVAIPGGPGLSGKYLDATTVELSKLTNLEAMIIDLPNHENSGRYWPNSGPIKYNEVQTILKDFFHELSRKNIRVILLGHSLGALISYDLMTNFDLPIEKAVLVSMPVALQRNNEFTLFLESVGASNFPWTQESEFLAWWKLALPGYFFHKPSSESTEILTRKTFSIANAHFTDGLSMPTPLTEAKVIIEQRKLIYIEGEKEIVLPEGNFQKIQKLLPGVSLVKLLGAGHFPMLEDQDQFLKIVTKFVSHCSNLLLSQGQKGEKQ